MSHSIIEKQEQIYESASSRIYRAYDKAQYKQIIIKILNKNNPSPVEIGQFRNEYKIARKYDHVNIIKVFNLITYENAPAIVMEDFGGESLYRIFRNNDYDLLLKLRIALRIAKGIDAIHQKGIIHKDINPPNIVWCPKLDLIKIIDFGISSNEKENNYDTKPINTLEGTLAYLSPEQTGRMNKTIDHRTDLYAFGVTLFWLFTGKLPFIETDPVKLIHAHLAKCPDHPSEINPNIPPVLGEIILKLMAKDATDRYQSASGVAEDLNQCIQNFSNSGDCYYFNIGEKDVIKKFLIPQKLYGRTAEIEANIKEFLRVCHTGDSTLMLVSGRSGVGKTVLVNEINKTVVAQNAIFITGKFGQLEDALPHKIIIQAFGDLIKHMLAEPEERLAAWKQKINEAISPNGKIIIDVIPEAEFVLGPQPDLLDLPPREAENRFNYILQNFISVFAHKNHPLVLFFDDLQWADIPTLTLIEGLLQSNTRYLYILGAYRSDEINESHPLNLFKKNLRDKKQSWQEIELAPLKIEAVNKMILETLKTSDEENIMGLAEICHYKTQGNPFHLIQLLSELYNKKVFKFNIYTRQWTWRKERMAQLAIMNDIVSLMMEKISDLPEKALTTFITAACVDSNPSLEKIKYACGLDTLTTYKHLSKAVKKALLIPSVNYKYFDIANENIEINFRFLHDHIRQAAYELIPPQKRSVYHKNIGLNFLEQLYSQSAVINIFDTVQQLNLASEILNGEIERRSLAQLNLDAANKAKSSSAWKQSAEYFQAGLNLLDQETWTTDYDLMFQLHAGAAETAYLESNFQLVDHYSKIALAKAKNILDKCVIWDIQISTLAAQGKLVECLNLGLSALKKLGINIRPHRSKMTMMISLLKTKASFNKIHDGLTQNQLRDPKIMAAYKILMNVTSSAYMSRKHLFVSVVLHTIALTKIYGYHFQIANSLAVFAGILGVIGDFKSADKFANLSLEMAERQDAKPIQAKVIYVANAFVKIWTTPYKRLQHHLLTGYHSGTETGDFEFAAFSIYCHFYIRFLSGEKLDSIEPAMQEYKDKIKLQDSVWSFFRLYHQVVINLSGRLTEPWVLNGLYCNEQEVIHSFKTNDNKVGLFDVYTKKLMLSYLFYQYAEAREAAAKVEKYYDAAMSKHDRPIAVFFEALIICEDIRKKRAITRDRIRRLKNNLKKMKKWADLAPANFKHKYLLMVAETKAVTGYIKQADTFYHKALEEVDISGITQEKALCYERIGLHFQSQGDADNYEHYIIKAFKTYRDWGAIAVCQAMRIRYADVFKTGSSVQQTGSMQPKPMRSLSALNTTESTELSSIDLLSIIKASQIISKEMNLVRLSDSLLQIVSENAGAQRGLFFIKNEKGEINLQSSYNSGNQNKTFPEAIINYTVRTQKPLILDDAASSEIYATDAYIRKKNIKSVLCIPLVRNNKAVGVLYLENNESKCAFSKKSVLVLQTIASQATIFIENAQLYSAAKESEQRYRSFFDNALDGIFQSTPDGRLLTANRALCDIFGYPNPDHMLKTIKNLANEVYVNPDQRQQFKKAIETQGFIKDFEAEFKKVGSRQNVSGVLNACVVRLENGDIIYEGTLKDITAKKQIERLRVEKKEAEAKATAKSLFLANMSHDIRTPLNGIIGMIGLLRQTPLNDDQRSYTKMASQSADHLLQIINDILDFSKIEAEKMEFESIGFNLRHTVEETVQLSAFEANKKQLKLTCSIAPQVPSMLQGDPRRLRQVIANLLNNAIKFTEHGEVALSVELISVQHDSVTLRFNVRDTGIGIPRDRMNRLFQPFSQVDASFTRRFGGTGLGLAICKSLTEKMQGSINVESVAGKGSIFWFTARFRQQISTAPYPPISSKVLTAPSTGPLPKAYYEKINILLVEDNYINQMVAAKVLENYGFKSDIAVNGLEAVQKLGAAIYDLVLMDIQMPIMDGYEATARIRDPMSNVHFHEIPIIAMTANAMQGDREKCLQAGMNDYIAKPIDSQALLIKLNKWLPLTPD